MADHPCSSFSPDTARHPVLIGTADRMRGKSGGQPTAWQLRDALGEALLPLLEAGDARSRVIRTDIGRLLRRIDAVGVALDTSAETDEHIRIALTDAFKALGDEVAKLQWMIGDALRVLDRLQHEIAAQSIRQRQQMDLGRQAARRRNIRRLRRLAYGLAAALLLAVAGGLVAVDRQADARRASREAASRLTPPSR